MAYAFGKNITYTFYPIADREFVSLAAVTTSPSIYVYKNKPTRTEAAAGTDNGNLVGSAITSWTATDDGNGKYFTIPAIDDPDPTSGKTEYTYYLAINFYLADSEQIQTLIRALPLCRIEAHHRAVSVTRADLEAAYNGLDDLVTDENQSAAIRTATERAKIDLEAMGFEWAEIWRPDRLGEAIKHKALANIMLQLVRQPQDNWFNLYNEYNGIYHQIIENLKLETIPDQDADPGDIAPVRGGGAMRIIR